MTTAWSSLFYCSVMITNMFFPIYIFFFQFLFFYKCVSLTNSLQEGMLPEEKHRGETQMLPEECWIHIHISLKNTNGIGLYCELFHSHKKMKIFRILGEIFNGDPYLNLEVRVKCTFLNFSVQGLTWVQNIMMLSEYSTDIREMFWDLNNGTLFPDSSLNCTLRSNIMLLSN